jgi:hypothetical protein
MGTPRQWFEGGIYENTYKKVDGVWRIHILNYSPQWHADFETGWANTRPQLRALLQTRLIRKTRRAPTLLVGDVWLWPTRKVLPFHNSHPVTGEPIVPQRWQGDIEREHEPNRPRQPRRHSLIIRAGPRIQGAAFLRD